MSELGKELHENIEEVDDNTEILFPDWREESYNRRERTRILVPNSISPGTKAKIRLETGEDEISIEALNPQNPYYGSFDFRYYHRTGYLPKVHINEKKIIPPQYTQGMEISHELKSIYDDWSNHIKLSSMNLFEDDWSDRLNLNNIGSTEINQRQMHDTIFFDGNGKEARNYAARRPFSGIPHHDEVNVKLEGQPDEEITYIVVGVDTYYSRLRWWKGAKMCPPTQFAPIGEYLSAKYINDLIRTKIAEVTSMG